MVNDRIADSVFQQMPPRPNEIQRAGVTGPEWRLFE